MARPRTLAPDVIEAINDLRLADENKWSLKKLASLFSVDKSTVSKIVNGDYSWDPSDDHPQPPSNFDA